jgi:CarD family transcriptional regulator
VSARAGVAAAKPRKPKVAVTKTRSPIAKPVIAAPAAEIRVTTPASAAPQAAAPPPARHESGIVPRMTSRGYVPLVDIPKPPPPPRDFTLNVGDKAVHPSHGLAEVTAIEHREIGSMKGEFYILRIIDNGMRVMVPRASSSAAGIRPVMSSKEADRVLETMKAREVAVDLQPWSRRFRAYTEMIKCGSPQEVAKVLRDMYRLKFDKDLSFGERRLLDQAKSLLLKELAAAKGVAEPVLQAQIDDMFRA